jgi:pimeloyl-ACP methyl ester carboxylesterase
MSYSMLNNAFKQRLESFSNYFFPGLMTNSAPTQIEYSELDYPFELYYTYLSSELEIAHTDEGSSKTTLIFIHGLGSYLPVWRKNIADLSAHYRCIALDLPGYGKSSKSYYPCTMDFYADAIAELITTLGLTSVVLCGHSMGGQIAMYLALKYPALVSHLILFAPAGFEVFTPEEQRWFLENIYPEAVQETPQERIWSIFQHTFYAMPSDAHGMAVDRIALRGAIDFDKYCYTISMSVRGMLAQPIFDHLHQIQQPALVLFGENDNLIPNRLLHSGSTRQIAQTATQRMPNAKLQMISRAGHFLQFEKPKECNQHVERFLL